MSRTLAYIPVLHSPDDLGALASAIARTAGYGARAAAYWENLASECHQYGPAWHGIPVYQEGLPDSGPDVAARIVARVDTPNYRLLRWLGSAGAVVLGTEDPVLLREERELLGSRMADAAALRVHAARAAALLGARDRYIAARIGASLPEGGTGVLFIGLRHDLARLLADDIAVTSLRACRDLLPSVPGYAARQAADQERAEAAARRAAERERRAREERA